MNNSVDLKTRIMRRVYAVWMLRKVFSPFAMKVYIALVIGWQMAARVHVAMVLNNAPSVTNVHDSLSFFSAAFSQAEFTLQLILLTGVVLALWLGRDMISSLAHSQKHSFSA